MTSRIRYTICILCAMLAACAQQQPSAPVASAEKKPEHVYTENGSVKQIMIMPETVDFPEGEGKNEFMAYCAVCHSLKYISSQPDFPRKTWEAEVHKMIEKYGAPVDSVTGKKIVDYLVAIKGTE